jgi:hypothetical protein
MPQSLPTSLSQGMSVAVITVDGGRFRPPVLLKWLAVFCFVLFQTHDRISKRTGLTSSARLPDCSTPDPRNLNRCSPFFIAMANFIVKMFR